MIDGVLLVSHGTVENLDELEEFAVRIRRGRPAPPELVSELRRRYEAIGGRSPLAATSAMLATKLEARLRVPVAWAGRHAPPFIRDTLIRLVEQGVSRVAVVPLAQHSASIYGGDALIAARGLPIELVCSDNWGQEPGLSDAFARRIEVALAGRQPVPATTLLCTAHSLPRFVIDAGDPYESEVRASALAIGNRLPQCDANVTHAVAFQSQGLAGAGPGGPASWLGPDLPTALDAAQSRGDRMVVFAPIGFLADHVEVLYDLDIEARGLATARGLTYVRASLPNADDDLVDVIAIVVSRLLK